MKYLSLVVSLLMATACGWSQQIKHHEPLDCMTEIASTDLLMTAQGEPVCYRGIKGRLIECGKGDHLVVTITGGVPDLDSKGLIHNAVWSCVKDVKISTPVTRAYGKPRYGIYEQGAEINEKATDSTGVDAPANEPLDTNGTCKYALYKFKPDSNVVASVSLYATKPEGSEGDLIKEDVDKQFGKMQCPAATDKPQDSVDPELTACLALTKEQFKLYKDQKDVIEVLELIKIAQAGEIMQLKNACQVKSISAKWYNPEPEPLGISCKGITTVWIGKDGKQQSSCTTNSTEVPAHD